MNPSLQTVSKAFYRLSYLANAAVVGIYAIHIYLGFRRDFFQRYGVIALVGSGIALGLSAGAVNLSSKGKRGPAAISVLVSLVVLALGCLRPSLN